MLSIKQAIIVEGKYDKMRLEKICNAPVFTTDGFRIFKDKEKREFFRKLAKTRGILILTDSDRAGFMIRNHIKGFIGEENIIHAYIPEIFGKERRKAAPSKERKLGVEGIDEAILEDVLKKYLSKEASGEKITKTDLFEKGLYGGTDSAAARIKLCSYLSIPKNISVNSLVDALNALITKEEFFKYTEDLLCTKDTDKD